MPTEHEQAKAACIEPDGSRPKSVAPTSVISAEPTVDHGETQEMDANSEQATEPSAPRGDAAGKEEDAAESGKLERLPSPLLAQLDVIAREECSIHQVLINPGSGRAPRTCRFRVQNLTACGCGLRQSRTQEAELRAKIAAIKKKMQVLAPSHALHAPRRRPPRAARCPPGAAGGAGPQARA
jgi:hypothetical protein